MQFVSAPPLPRLKIGSLLPGYPLSTPLTFQAKIRAVTALLNGVTASYRSCRGYASDLLIDGVLPAPGISTMSNKLHALRRVQLHRATPYSLLKGRQKIKTPADQHRLRVALLAHSVLILNSLFFIQNYLFICSLALVSSPQG